jgi:putative ABC transport system substrate-binding protein
LALKTIWQAESGSVEAGALATQGIDYYISIARAEETQIIVNEDSLKALSIEKIDNKNIVYVKSKKNLNMM